MDIFGHHYPVDIRAQVDFVSPQALRRLARNVQTQLIRRLILRYPEYGKLPRYSFPQKRLVPSQKEIAASLPYGGYSEYIRGTN